MWGVKRQPMPRPSQHGDEVELNCTEETPFPANLEIEFWFLSVMPNWKSNSGF